MGIGDGVPGPNVYQSVASLAFKGPKFSMKSRNSPFVLVFPSERVNTLKVE
jgi:hypothetical protein